MVYAEGVIIPWNNWKSPLISLSHSPLNTRQDASQQSAVQALLSRTFTIATIRAWVGVRDIRGVGSFRLTPLYTNVAYKVTLAMIYKNKMTAEGRKRYRRSDARPLTNFFRTHPQRRIDMPRLAKYTYIGIFRIPPLFSSDCTDDPVITSHGWIANNKLEMCIPSG